MTSEPQWILGEGTVVMDEATICHLMDLLPEMLTVEDDVSSSLVATIKSCLTSLETAFAEQAIDGAANERIHVNLTKAEWEFIDGLL